MRAFKLPIIICMCLPLTAFGNQADVCLENARTQTEMNRCEGMNFERADAELNRVYRTIRKVYKDDNVFLDKLKESQLAWIKLRDADMELRFPHENKQSQYGSVFPMCYSTIKTTLTLQRVEFLRQWLEGIEEGDVCGGSIKHPQAIHEASKIK